MQYPYGSICINGREETLEAIRSGMATATSAFEQHTFDFIREWLSGAEHFDITTSGSTGTPKRIVITRDQMTASASLTRDTLGLRAGENALVCLDTRYIAGRMMVVRCFVTGMRIIAQNPTANPCIDLPDAIPIHFAALVPYQVYAVVRSSVAHKLSNIDNIIIGGAALDAETQQYLESFRGICYATYAMTETLSHIALQPLNGGQKDDNFHVLKNISIRLDDRGCLVIRAPYLTEEVITNDLAEITGPGMFRWLGRFDNIINSGGIKIIPEHLEKEIQEVFQEHDIGGRFFITSLPDIKLGNRVVLIVEGQAWEADRQTALESAIRNRLPKNQAPREILFVPKFEMTDTGKVNRNSTVEKLRKSNQGI